MAAGLRNFKLQSPAFAAYGAQQQQGKLFFFSQGFHFVYNNGG